MAKSSAVTIICDTKGVGDHAESAMTVYGNYAIFDRAVADVRDGLKPVQRRILYAMHMGGMRSDRAHKKSLDTVGQVLGRFHPHGDSSVYDALVAMTKLRYPLVDGHGNFGGKLFEAAASRYTEARLTELAETGFEQISIVDTVANYSATETEPIVIPTRLPWLLLNGSYGIAVAIRAGIPPHNLGEVVDACLALIKDPSLTTKQLMEHVRGPDHGAGILLSSKKEIEALYETGRGSLQYRCAYKFVDDTLEVSGTCPGFNPHKFLKRCQELVDEGLLKFCSNQSQADFRAVIGFTDPKIVQDKVLPKLTASESYQFWTITRTPETEVNKLQQYSLRGLLQEFIDFRMHCESLMLERDKQNLIRKRSRFLALIEVVKNYPEVRKIMDAASSKADAVSKIYELLPVGAFEMEDVGHALESPIWSLAKVSVASTLEKVKEVNVEIGIIEQNLTRVAEVVSADLLQLRERFSDKRGTSLSAREQVIETSMTYVMGIRKSGAGARDFDNRAKSYFDFALPCKETFFVVRNKAPFKATAHPAAYSPQLDISAELAASKSEVVGVFKSDDLYFAAVHEDGLGVWCQPGTTEGFVSKGTTDLVSVSGVGEGESIAFVSGKGTFLLYESSSFSPENAMRRGSKPQRIDGFNPTERTIQVLRIPVGAVLFDDDGEIDLHPEIFARDGTLPFKGKLFAVSDKNYALLTDGRKGVFTRKQLEEVLSSVVASQPL